MKLLKRTMAWSKSSSLVLVKETFTTWFKEAYLMRTYEKIETVFNRDTVGTKKLILGDFRNETIEFLQNILLASSISVSRARSFL